MEEKDYVLATNLAKVRILNLVVRSLFPDSVIEKEELKKLILTLDKWDEKLTAKT